MSLKELQDEVCSRDGLRNLRQYVSATRKFLRFIRKFEPTRIVSPSTPNYIFYQYDRSYRHRITRPLNTELFLEDERRFNDAYLTLRRILEVLSRTADNRTETLREQSLDVIDIDRVVYTIQQSLGSIADSLADPNQARKRVGMLFEGLVKLIIQAVGVSCESRNVKIPLPGHPGRFMSYEIDLAFSRGGAIVASETEVIGSGEILGSVKTTSKDRIDKVFLDKFLLSRLLGRDVRVVGVFLHDVQRAKKQGNIFGVNSTFKTNHFLGYSIALTPLDGVYYVDPRPVMASDEALAQRIGGFSRFVVDDLWRL